MYSRKLLIRGWAGKMTAVERAYVRTHRPLTERQEEALSHARERSPLARRPAEAAERVAETAPVGEVVARGRGESKRPFVAGKNAPQRKV
jgi:hypothetical protein